MKNSLKYSSIVVLCGGQIGSPSESEFKFMGGCQSTQLTFTSSIVREKALGRKKTFYLSEYDKDTVSFPLEWYPSDFENEERAGMNLIGSSGKSISYKLFEGYRTNIMVLVDDKSEYDLLKKDISGTNAIFLSNSDIVDYSLSAQVGSIAQAKASFECDDAWISMLTGYSGNYTGISDGKSISKPFKIAETGAIQGNFSQVFIPSGISVEIKDRYNDQVYDLNISSFNFNIDFTRNSIKGFGSKYDMRRTLKAPVFGNIQIEVQSPYFSGRQYPIKPKQELGFDIKLTMKGTSFNGESPQDFEFEFREVYLNTDSTSFAIGSNAMNSLTFDLEDHGSDY